MMTDTSEQSRMVPYARTMHPHTTSPKHGELIQHVPLATAADTAGQLMLNEAVLYPGNEPPLHTHTREDEAFYVLEGTMTFTVGSENIVATPGTFVWLPRAIPHTFTINTEHATALVHILPANLEHYFIQLAHLFQTEHITAKPYPSAFYEKWQELSLQFGITLAAQETPLD